MKKTRFTANAAHIVSSSMEEANARLHYLVEHQRRLGLLLGGAGVGKSTMLKQAARSLRKEGAETAVIDVFGMNELDFLWTTSTKLGVTPSVHETSFRLWRGIADRLLENQLQQLSTVLLIDHADQAAGDVLALVQRLINLADSPLQKFTVVVAARPENVEQLGPMILERCDLRMDLEPWSHSETSQYVQAAARKLEIQRGPQERQAADCVQSLTQGVARQVAQLSDLAAIAASAAEPKQLLPDVIGDVYRELAVIGIGPVSTF